MILSKVICLTVLIDIFGSFHGPWSIKTFSADFFHLSANMELLHDWCAKLFTLKLFNGYRSKICMETTDLVLSSLNHWFKQSIKTKILFAWPSHHYSLRTVTSQNLGFCSTLPCTNEVQTVFNVSKVWLYMTSRP